MYPNALQKGQSGELDLMINAAAKSIALRTQIYYQTS